MNKSVVAALCAALLLASCGTKTTPEPDLNTQGVRTAATTQAAVAWDGSLNTVYTLSTLGSSLTYDLGSVQGVSSLRAAFSLKSGRAQKFGVQGSADSVTWVKLASGLSTPTRSGQYATYAVSGQARYVRLVNESGTSFGVAELQVTAQPAPTPTPTPAPAPLPGALRNFYVDCAAGSDQNAGTTETQALKTLAAVNALSLKPGDQVNFKSGCRFTGTLKAAHSGTAQAPIVYTRYGAGELPIFSIVQDGAAVYASGSYVVFDQLSATSSRPPVPSGAAKCPTTPVGYRVGFELAGQNSVVRQVRATGLMAGVRLTGNRNVVVDSTFTNNNVMKRNTPGTYDDDSGAWGVLVNSNDNEVSRNTFSGNWACSEDYKVDGASVEMYEASGNLVRGNLSKEDITFTELGGTAGNHSERNIFRDNIYSPTQVGGVFLTIRGHLSHWGGNTGTQFHGNIGYMVDLGINCTEGCGPDILSAYDNILWQRDLPGGNIDGKAAVWADAPFDEGRNTFWKNDGQPYAGLARGTLSATNRVANPQFANPLAYDFRTPLLSPLAMARR